MIFDFIVQKDRLHDMKLSAFQQFMIVLIILRHNASLKDLGYRFGVHASTISQILLKWLTIMDICLKPLIFWPERDYLRKTMPECFHVEYGNKVAVIIDCFEVFIERP